MLTAPSVPSSPRKVTASENDLNALLQEQTLSGSVFPVSSPHLKITPGAVTLEGYVLWHGRYFPVRTDVTPEVRNGDLSVHLQTISVAGVPLPGAIRTGVEDQIAGVLRQRAGPLRRIRAISLGNGYLTFDLR